MAEAVSVIRWRDRFLCELAALAKKNGRRAGPGLTRALKALFPNFGEIFSSLRTALARTRKTSTPDVSMTEWQNWLCDQARFEVAGRFEGDAFAKFLPLGKELLRRIDLDAVKGTTIPIWREAARILAARLGVGLFVIVHCERARPAPAKEMRRWLLASHVAAPPSPPQIGRKRDAIYDKACDRQRSAGLKPAALAKQYMPEAWRKNPGAARRKMAEALRRRR